MRRFLDALYNAAAALAAVCMVALLVMVLLSVFGRQFNFHVPGTDAYAGYLMAASGFLALAHTLKKGEHIRVTLVLGALSAGPKRAMEIWAHGAGALIAILVAIYSCRLVWQSHSFHDISTSNDATPLWIPQLAMAAGTIILVIAFIDELLIELGGKRVTVTATEALRNE